MNASRYTQSEITTLHTTSNGYFINDIRALNICSLYNNHIKSRRTPFVRSCLFSNWWIGWFVAETERKNQTAVSNHWHSATNSHFLSSATSGDVFSLLLSFQFWLRANDGDDDEAENKIQNCSACVMQCSIRWQYTQSTNSNKYSRWRLVFSCHENRLAVEALLIQFFSILFSFIFSSLCFDFNSDSDSRKWPGRDLCQPFIIWKLNIYRIQFSFHSKCRTNKCRFVISEQRAHTLCEWVWWERM